MIPTLQPQILICASGAVYLYESYSLTDEMINEKHVTAVKKSWRMLRDIDPALLGDVFYSRLFLLHPELSGLFKGPMDVQHKKLIDMLSFLVSQLHRLDDLADEVATMGQRHGQYGVKPEHYDSVGEALLWTLQTGLGRDWNEEVAQAWGAVYGVIAQKMQEPAPPSH